MHTSFDRLYHQIIPGYHKFLDTSKHKKEIEQTVEDFEIEASKEPPPPATIPTDDSDLSDESFIVLN
jgi:hypothetical protein